MSDIVNLLIELAIVIPILLLALLANAAERIHWVRWVLYGFLVPGGLLMLAVLAGAALSPDPSIATLLLAVASGVNIVWLAVMLTAPLRRLVFRPFPADPDSVPHLYGAVLFVWFSTFFLWQLWLFDPEALARALKEANFTLWVAIHLVWWVLLSFAGAGLFIRRSWPETLERLGIRLPTSQGVKAAILSALIWLVGSIVLEELVMRHWLPEQYQIGKMLESALAVEGSWAVLLFSALIIAAGAGIGEELFFRGLLQPVFGLIATSFLFTIIHFHYGPTYSLGLIVAGSLLMGYLRNRYGTVSAMIMHGLFNFLAFLLFALQKAPSP